jgi:hypothetical protein
MKHYLILSLALGFTACIVEQSGLTSQSSNLEPQPGQLQFAYMHGMQKVSVSGGAVHDSTTYEFNLDTAKSSIQQYFILQNTGDFDVHNIKLTTNNSQKFKTIFPIPKIFFPMFDRFDLK